MLTVHWAGEGSDVVVCLARNPSQSADTSSSVFVSYDYGRTFVRKVLASFHNQLFGFRQSLMARALFSVSLMIQDELFKLPNGKQASIGRFFNHPKVNSHVRTCFLTKLLF